MRQQFARAFEPLGIVPFYPLRERVQIGDVFLVDVATLEPGGDSAAYAPTSDVVTKAAAPFFEKYRADNMASKNRFPCSSDKLCSQIVLSGLTPSFYQQPDCPASSSTGSDTTPKPGTAQAANGVVVNVYSGTAPAPAVKAGAAKTPETKAAVQSLAPLEMAGMPAYSLASIDNVTLAGAAPTGFANFLAAIGISRSTSLVVQPEGVELATLPSDQLAAAINDGMPDARQCLQ